jgi:hypothetical protein
MDLISLAAALYQNQAKPDANIKAAKELLPKPQETRSYSDAKPQPFQVKPRMMKIKFGEERSEYVMRFLVQWPMYARPTTVTPEQMKAFAKEYLLSNSINHDEKYIDIVRCDMDYVTYQWNIEKWFRDNFATGAKYTPPISIDFHFHPVPRILFSNVVLSGLERFMIAQFKIWARDNKRKLYDKHFRFLKVITPDIFDYRVDWRLAVIRLTVKYSVIIGALAIYSAFKLQKKLSKDQVKQVAKKASDLGDLDHLDRYLKGL